MPGDSPRRRRRSATVRPHGTRGPGPVVPRRHSSEARPARRARRRRDPRAPTPHPRSTIRVARSRLPAISSSIRSSIVPAQTSRCTCTTRVWPMRWARSVAWSSTAGFHQRSKWKTWFAAVRLSPSPPALSDITSTRGSRRLLEAVDDALALRAAASTPSRYRRSTSSSRSQVTRRARPMTAYCVKTSALSPSRDASRQHLGEPVELARAAGQRPVSAERVHRVVADLLEARDQGEHVAAPLDARRARGRGQHGRRSSPGRAPPARPSACRTRSSPAAAAGRAARPGRSCAGAAGTARSSAAARPRRGSRRRSIGDANRRRKPVRVPSRPGFRMCMIDHRSSSRFSTGVPVSATRWPAVDRTRRLGRARERVLDRLGLVEHERAPLDPDQQAAVARQQRVGREHDVPGLELLGAARCGRGRGGCGRAQVGGEPVQLALPVAEHRGRARRSAPAARAVGAIEQVGDQLHRLAEAHVVGQERAQPELAHPQTASPGRPSGTGRSGALEALGRLEPARRSSGSRSSADQLRRAPPLGSPTRPPSPRTS